MIDLVPVVITAVALVVMLVILRALLRQAARRTHEAMAHGRWEPMAPDERHALLADVVAELEAEGYLVESYSVVALGGATAPAVVLGHADGSVASATALRSLTGHRVSLEVQTPVVPGERWLTTVASGVVMLPSSSLVEIVARRADVAAAVARHCAGRAWLVEQGVVLHLVPLGSGGTELEATMRAAARDRLPVGLGSVVASLGPGRGGLRRPLWERPRIEAEIAAIRDQQAAGRRSPD